MLPATTESGGTLPSIILKDETFFTPDQDEFRNWSEAFPNVDVVGELRKMSVWSQANPARRKTKRGVRRFIVNWLSHSKTVQPGRGRSTRERSLAEDLTDTSWAD